MNLGLVFVMIGGIDMKGNVNIEIGNTRFVDILSPKKELVDKVLYTIPYERAAYGVAMVVDTGFGFNDWCEIFNTRSFYMAKYLQPEQHLDYNRSCSWGRDI